MDIKTKKTVFCSLRIEGTHKWERCDLQSVAFLKHPHRHMFHIKAYKAVKHEDRDIEFIMLKRAILEWLHANYISYRGCIDFGGNSCEHIAKRLCGQFNLSKCEVSEDGENGAIVEVIQ